MQTYSNTYEQKQYSCIISLLTVMVLCTSSIQAQFVNFEDTWREFLSDNKTANVSKLPKPSKSEPQSFAKFCLMYANNYFCGGRIDLAEKLVKEINVIGEAKYKVIPGFKPRFDDLTAKIEAANKAHGLWLNFLKTKNITIEELNGVSTAFKVCEKGTLAKYSYMLTYAHYCNGDLEKAKRGFENYLLKIVDKTSLKVEDVEGLGKEVEMMRQLFKGLAALKPAWSAFIQTDTSKGFDVELPLISCNPIPSMKAYMLKAAENVCQNGADMLKKIKELEANNSQEIEADLAAKIKWLEKEVGTQVGDLTALNKAWIEFTKTDTLKNGIQFGYKYCDKVAQIKACIINGTINACSEGQQMLDNIALTQKDHNPKLDDITVTKLKALKALVKKHKADSLSMATAWMAFLKNNDQLAKPLKLKDFYCDKAIQIKGYTMIGLTHTCEKGETMLQNIKLIQKKYNPELGDTLVKKIEKLSHRINTHSVSANIINKHWAAFLKNKDSLTTDIELADFYCDKADYIKGYLMIGLTHICEKGEAMLAEIKKIQDQHQPSLGDTVTKKFQKLVTLVHQHRENSTKLQGIWKDFIANNDTMLRPFQVVDFYCDKIDQVKSWVVKGHMDYCKNGQGYLNKIDTLQQQHQLKFEDELACRILRLRGKVWDCRYWELVAQARKETHEERERFGPQSAQIMQQDLNSNKLPCNTTAKYDPLKFTGVKYVISTYLCQNIDLAKMGDPEYYKKIATWVDSKVLQKYCEGTMRCKENFYIYLEGHTDGYAFRGRRYKKSLNIPAGTPYTHFEGKNKTSSKETRAISTRLDNNVELGIARAWTVKQQLEFMNVPILIGAYEHPKHEKGGQYRKVDIELNIPNLLLDFYEKRLKALLEAAGIGERPEKC